MHNPFAQSAHYWKVLFSLPSSAVGTAEEAFNDITVAVSAFETDEANHIWTFELLFETEPDVAEINRRFMVIAALHAIAIPELQILKLAQQDWLAHVARDFPPLAIGRFYVHGSHIRERAPTGSIPIQVEAGAAFGSGEHGTTSGCLEAMDALSRKRHFVSILDMGTGSGILAIAAAKLWKTNVLAVDIDDVAVRVTRENAAINQVSQYIRAEVSDGYDSALVNRSKPYDLILSNILARPLVQFAPKLAEHLAEDGIAILSGLLTSQETQVLAAHRLQRLVLKRKIVKGEWCSLVLGRR